MGWHALQTQAIDGVLVPYMYAYNRTRRWRNQVSEQASFLFIFYFICFCSLGANSQFRLPFSHGWEVWIFIFCPVPALGSNTVNSRTSRQALGSKRQAKPAETAWQSLALGIPYPYPYPCRPSSHPIPSHPSAHSMSYKYLPTTLSYLTD